MLIQDTVIFEQRGCLGLITLNRPGALNAIDLPMVEALLGQLQRWAQDPSVTVVAIWGAGGKAFCAGGDMRGFYDRRNDPDLASYAEKFFATEYRLNLAIHRFPKPYVAFMNGIVMGGGAGLSVHGRYRVATELTKFAMPETAIGFFPDIGGVHFLNHCPGKVGEYLALTGLPVGPDHCAAFGLSNRFIQSNDIPDILELLERGHDPAQCLPVPSDIPTDIRDEQSLIDRYFNASNLADVLSNLQRGDHAWCQKIAAVLASRSPLALVITWDYIQRAKGWELDRILAQDFALTKFFIRQHDFFEGIRSVLIDKDRNPQWEFSALEQIPAERVSQAFQGQSDESFLTEFLS